MTISTQIPIIKLYRTVRQCISCQLKPKLLELIAEGIMQPTSAPATSQKNGPIRHAPALLKPLHKAAPCIDEPERRVVLYIPTW